MISTVLFDLPQIEIVSLITDRMTRASDFSIVTGFATPGGQIESWKRVSALVRRMGLTTRKG